jgi:[CysO sulfur-carrier protein]-S-L-cysteine hydrolase
MVASNEAFVVRIPAAMYEEMVAHVVAGYPNETCGMLASKDGQVVKNYPTANAAEHPDDFSEISPKDQLDIYNDMEKYGGEEYAYYHSHPKSEAYPSPRDIEFARYNRVIYIIFSHQHYPELPYARAFLIAEDATITEGKIEVV